MPYPEWSPIVPNSWFGGLYKDDKPENFFAQFGTDPDEFPKVYPEMQLPPDQLAAWQRDRAGVIVSDELAQKYGWKIGDRIVLQGTIYPVNLELTIRGIFHWPDDEQKRLLQREVRGRGSELVQRTGRHFQHHVRIA